MEKISTEQIIENFDIKIKAMTDSIAFRLKEHPRAVSNLVQLRTQIMDVIKDYFLNNKTPEVHIQTQEEIEDSLARTYVKKSKKVRPVISKPEIVDTPCETKSEDTGNFNKSKTTATADNGIMNKSKSAIVADNDDFLNAE